MLAYLGTWTGVPGGSPCVVAATRENGHEKMYSQGMTGADGALAAPEARFQILRASMVGNEEHHAVASEPVASCRSLCCACNKEWRQLLLAYTCNKTVCVLLSKHEREAPLVVYV